MYKAKAAELSAAFKELIFILEQYYKSVKEKRKSQQKNYCTHVKRQPLPIMIS
ncbi:hypothetical protein I5907_12455 [Panacibacter sp. DH6]|uniref:Uncharacterized protein n=1 Tax=Panacibacter microcysteis TaxID=2793269 RepID=A0A931E8G7_9BACT|nr:hypothetical protein [Panacibacter microcysteis]MBG9377048.1 hypothetical protein [Panacibacter microcysteis]